MPHTMPLTARPQAESGVLLRCETTADFLAALPALTGFTAVDSLFLVCFSGSRAGRALRIDLPDESDPRAILGFLDFLSGRLADVARRDGRVSPAAVVISTSESFAHAGVTPRRALARRIERRLRRDGFALRELCCLAPDGWASYHDPDAPAAGRPLSEIDASPVTRYLEADPSFSGSPAVSLDELSALPHIDPERRSAVAAALGSRTLPEPEEASPLHSGSGSLTDEARVRADAQRFESRLGSRGAPGAGETADLLGALARPDRWFVILLTALAPAAVVADLCGSLPFENHEGLILDIDAEPGESPEVGWSVLRMMTNLPLEAIDVGRLRSAIAVTAELTAVAPGHWRTGASALLAVLWWLRGLQSVAEVHVGAALADETHLTDLTAMVGRLVREYASPGW